MKRLAIVLIVTGLSGCGSGDMDDLHRFVAETGKDMQGKIDPLPEVKAYARTCKGKSIHCRR